MVKTLRKTDVVVIGSNPGALTAAIACRQAGWEVLVVEPGPRLGSREASGPGQLWLPARHGIDDICTDAWRWSQSHPGGFARAGSKAAAV